MPRLLTGPDAAADAIAGRAAVVAPSLRPACRVPLVGLPARPLALGAGHEAIAQQGLAGRRELPCQQPSAHGAGAPGADPVLVGEVQIEVVLRLVQGYAWQAGSEHGLILGGVAAHQLQRALAGDRWVRQLHGRAVLVDRGAVADGRAVALRRDVRVRPEALNAQRGQQPSRRDGERCDGGARGLAHNTPMSVGELHAKRMLGSFLLPAGSGTPAGLPPVVPVHQGAQKRNADAQQAYGLGRGEPAEKADDSPAAGGATACRCERVEGFSFHSPDDSGAGPRWRTLHGGRRPADRDINLGQRQGVVGRRIDLVLDALSGARQQAVHLAVVGVLGPDARSQFKPVKPARQRCSVDPGRGRCWVGFKRPRLLRLHRPRFALAQRVVRSDHLHARVVLRCQRLAQPSCNIPRRSWHDTPDLHAIHGQQFDNGIRWVMVGAVGRHVPNVLSIVNALWNGCIRVMLSHLFHGHSKLFRSLIYVWHIFPRTRTCATRYPSQSGQRMRQLEQTKLHRCSLPAENCPDSCWELVFEEILRFL
uniref:Uncharacterized protein n=1 Tax=Populus trichocarpa TaxID=3694 RepID=U7DWF8_POPTR